MDICSRIYLRVSDVLRLKTGSMSKAIDSKKHSRDIQRIVGSIPTTQSSVTVKTSCKIVTTVVRGVNKPSGSHLVVVQLSEQRAGFLHTDFELAR